MVFSQLAFSGQPRTTVFRLLLTIVLLASASGLPADELRSGIATDNLDTRVRPQDNLFAHVNGQWLERTEIPADESNYGSFTMLSDEAIENIHTIMQQAANTPNAAGNVQRIGDFSWPGHLPEGEVREQLAHSCDWLPTLDDKELFLANLDADVSEMNNLAAAHPEVVEELQHLHDDWAAGLHAVESQGVRGHD